MEFSTYNSNFETSMYIYMGVKYAKALTFRRNSRASETFAQYRINFPWSDAVVEGKRLVDGVFLPLPLTTPNFFYYFEFSLETLLQHLVENTISLSSYFSILIFFQPQIYASIKDLEHEIRNRQICFIFFYFMIEKQIHF